MPLWVFGSFPEPEKPCSSTHFIKRDNAKAELEECLFISGNVSVENYISIEEATEAVTNIS